jgi:hypothetical protein
LPPFIDKEGVEYRDVVTIDGRSLSFGCARHLALVSYMTVTWSIYDRLANVCGRLSAAKHIGSSNPKQNPKLVEDFLTMDDKGNPKKVDWFLGFFCHDLAWQAYFVPVQISYKLRNWLVHEGYELGSVPLFEGGNISDRLILSEEAVKILRRASRYQRDGNKVQLSCIDSKDDVFDNRDLISLLELCHSEIDRLFQGLSQWTVTSFVEQIKAFSRRV